MRLSRFTESKALEMSKEAIQISLQRLLAAFISEVMIEMGSKVLWFLRPAKLNLESTL